MALLLVSILPHLCAVTQVYMCHDESVSVTLLVSIPEKWVSQQHWRRRVSAAGQNKKTAVSFMVTVYKTICSEQPFKKKKSLLDPVVQPTHQL